MSFRSQLKPTMLLVIRRIQLHFAGSWSVSPWNWGCQLNLLKPVHLARGQLEYRVYNWALNINIGISEKVPPLTHAFKQLSPRAN